MGKQDYYRSSKSGPNIGWDLFLLKWILIGIPVLVVIGLCLPDEEIVIEKLDPKPVEFYWDKARERAIQKGTYRRNHGYKRNPQYKVNFPWPAPEPDVWIEMEKDGYNDIID